MTADEQLLRAILNARLTEVDQALACGADPNYHSGESVRAACQVDSPEILQHLLDNGFQVSCRQNLNQLLATLQRFPKSQATRLLVSTFTPEVVSECYKSLLTWSWESSAVTALTAKLECLHPVTQTAAMPFLAIKEYLSTTRANNRFYASKTFEILIQEARCHSDYDIELDAFGGSPALHSFLRVAITSGALAAAAALLRDLHENTYLERLASQVFKVEASGLPSKAEVRAQATLDLLYFSQTRFSFSKDSAVRIASSHEYRELICSGSLSATELLQALVSKPSNLRAKQV